MSLPVCTRVLTELPARLPPPSELLRFERLATILGVLLIFLTYLERRFSLVSRFHREESSSTNLAVARIATMIALLSQVHYTYIQHLAALDHALLVPFGIWGRLAMRLPLSHHAIALTYTAFLITAALALVGLFTRTACALTCILSLYLLCIPQLTGKVDHDVGHLTVFSFLLALSPSGDALSLDAFRLGRRSADLLLWLRPRRARVYATALQTMVLYVGVAYFFPGLWKLVAYGTDWFHPSHMHTLIAVMWDGIGLNPFQVWYLSHPSLLILGAIASIVFELGFIFAILSPATRWLVIPVGLIFHNFTFLFMGISFAGLQCIYVIFFDWTPLADRPSWPAANPGFPVLPGTRQTSRVLVAACIFVLAGVTITGALRKMTTWPIDCYPTFDWPISVDYDVRTLQATDIRGDVHIWPVTYDPAMLKFFGNERWKAMVRNDFGNPDPVRTRAALQLWLAHHPAPALSSAEITDTIYRRPDSIGSPILVSSCILQTLTPSEIR